MRYFKLILTIIILILTVSFSLNPSSVLALSCPAAYSQSSIINQVSNGCFADASGPPIQPGQNGCVHYYWPCDTNDNSSSSCSGIDCEGTIVSNECASQGHVSQKLHEGSQICQTVTVSPYTNFTLGNQMYAGNSGGNAQLGYQVGALGSPQWVTDNQSGWNSFSLSGYTNDQTTLYVYLNDQAAGGPGVSDTYFDGVNLSLGNGSQCWATSPPSGTVYVGQTYAASVSMKNTGGTTWSNPTYSLKSQSGNTWGATGAVLSNGTIAPNSVGIFNFNVTAPSTPGFYSFNWVMTQPGIGDFGQSCNSNVTVVASAPSPTATPTPISGSGYCDQNPVCTCDPSSAPKNTCNTGNGTGTCVYTGPGTCIQTPAPSQPGFCTINNCNPGNICSASGVCIPDQTNPTCTLSTSNVVTGNFTSWNASVQGGDNNKTYTWNSNVGSENHTGSTSVVSQDNSTTPPTYYSVWNNVLYSTPGSINTTVTISDPGYSDKTATCYASSVTPTPPSNLDVNGDVHSNGQ